MSLVHNHNHFHIAVQREKSHLSTITIMSLYPTFHEEYSLSNQVQCKHKNTTIYVNDTEKVPNFPNSWKLIQWNPAVSYVWLIFCLGLKVLHNSLYCIYRRFVSRSRDLHRQGHFWVLLHYYKVFSTRLKKFSKRAAPADLSTIEKPQKPNSKMRLL